MIKPLIFLNFLKYRNKSLFFILFTFLLVLNTLSQERKVTGLVTDEIGAPLQGTNISVKGFDVIEHTDIYGKFTIVLPAGAKVLTFSFVGFETTEVLVGQENNLIVALKEQLNPISEIVVIGYGNQKKSDLTGAISSYSGKKLNETPVIGVDHAMEGRATGVYVLPNSGMPSSQVTIKVRGTNSVAPSLDGGLAGPLVIIDGTPGDINRLSLNDVESIEVLKDASAGAIYGASGGNGVILITTRRGKKGKISSSFDYYMGVQEINNKVTVMNSNEYARTYNLYKDVIKNIVNDTVFYFKDPSKVPNTDWQNEIMRKGRMQNVNFRVSGGNEVSTYMFSMNYADQQGIVKKSYYKKFTIRLNSDHKLSKYLKIGENMQGRIDRYSGLNNDNNEYTSIVPNSVITLPIITPKDDSGRWNVPNPLAAGSNPAASLYYDNRHSDATSFTGNVYLEVEPIEGLKFESRIGGDLSFIEDHIFNPEYVITGSFFNPVSSLEKTFNKGYIWTWNNTLTYNTSFADKNNLTLMIGYEAQDKMKQYIYGKRFDLRANTPDWQYFDGSLDNSTIVLKGIGVEIRNIGVFGRINYNYNGKYLFTANYRNDGSSRFAHLYKYGGFPSLSFGWIFSEEDFISQLNILSFGKLRYGWGKIGNDDIKPFAYDALMQTSVYTDNYVLNNEVQLGAARGMPANFELHWEAIESSDIGLDLAFMRNSLSASFDYFQKQNNGMLTQINLPLLVGRYQKAPALEGGDSRPYANIGKFRNSGFEVSIGYRRTSGDFKCDFDFNFSRIYTKVLSITDSLMDGTVKDLSSICITKNGYAPFQFYGYRTNGLFHEEDARWIIKDGKRVQIIFNQPFRVNSRGDTIYQQPTARPGDIRFVDINGDKTIDGKDMTIIGDPNPNFIFGLSADLSYKNFDISFLLQGTYGNKVFNGLKRFLYDPTGQFNWAPGVQYAYRSPVYDASGNLTDPGYTNTHIFRVDPSNINNNLRVSDWYVEDGSYIRLRVFQLGFTFPASLSQQFGIDKFRIYIGGKNLLTYTRYTGFDPEVGQMSRLTLGLDKGAYPQARMFMAGININF
jgi:TonB-dependent starch-binding outer membrane protein SusC